MYMCNAHNMLYFVDKRKTHYSIMVIYYVLIDQFISMFFIILLSN